MTDTFTPEARSHIMASIKSRDTKPEMRVRSALHAAGFRFRLHRPDLPGKPDLVLPRFRTAVFVNGCFWHGHTCGKAALPTSNSDYWAKKIGRNQERDRRNCEALADLGWNVVVIWECDLRSQTQALIEELTRTRQCL